jgi:hypothetical protein
MKQEIDQSRDWDKEEDDWKMKKDDTKGANIIYNIKT